jgi:uncharacterized protein
MDIRGERRIPAPQRIVWAALNDPQVLQACLPGCIALARASDTEMQGVVNTYIGTVSAKLACSATLADADPPHSGGLLVEARDHMAGPISIQVGFSLTEDAAFTVLRYHVTGSAGGEFANQPASTARDYLEAFLNRFTAEAASTPEVAAGGVARAFAATANVSAHQGNPPAIASALGAIPAEIGGYPIVFWIGSALFLAIFFLVFSAYL